MKIIERPDSKKLISPECFEICLIDGKTKAEIAMMYERKDVHNRKSCYYIEKFIHHLKIVHNLSLAEYCEKYLDFNWPVCPTKGIKVGYKVHGNGVILSKFARGGMNKSNCPNFVKGCEKLSQDRMGENNPMFGATPWNKGLDNNDPRVQAIADKRTGTKMSDETKCKMRQRRAEHPLKARHTQPHSEEEKERMRGRTAKMWAEGVFNRVTSIQIKMREFLNTLQLKEPFREEYQAKYYSLDFAFPDTKIAIECDGTYYHVDPRIYPNGPKDKIQRRNFGRDKAKNKYLGDRGWIIIRCWETEINDGSFKEFIQNKLKELGICLN